MCVCVYVCVFSSLDLPNNTKVLQAFNQIRLFNGFARPPDWKVTRLVKEKPDEHRAGSTRSITGLRRTIEMPNPSPSVRTNHTHTHTHTLQ